MTTIYLVVPTKLFAKSNEKNSSLQLFGLIQCSALQSERIYRKEFLKVSLSGKNTVYLIKGTLSLLKDGWSIPIIHNNGLYVNS